MLRYILVLYKDNGKENGNYYSILGNILGIYEDNGKENGNYYSIFGFYWVQGFYSEFSYIRRWFKARVSSVSSSPT